MKRAYTSIILVGLPLSVVAFLYTSVPFAILGLLWCFLFALLAFSSWKRKGLPRVIFVNISLVCLIVALVEVYSCISFLIAQIPKATCERDFPEWYMAPHEFLGFAPERPGVAEISLTCGDEVIYQVASTIDEDGLRSSPKPESAADDECAVFFGGSIAVGDGVHDDETLPAAFGRLTGFSIYNFGFHGYGPNQMLAAIEHGVVDEVVDCTPRLIVYLGHTSNLYVSSGFASWGQTGPKYVLNDGCIESVGRFDEDGPQRYQVPFGELLMNLVPSRRGRCCLCAKLAGDPLWNVGTDDVDLFVGIIDESRTRLESVWPDTQFLVLLLADPNETLYEPLKTGFEEADVAIVELDPEDWQDGEQYLIHELDPHPNALAYELVAQFLVNRFVDQTD